MSKESDIDVKAAIEKHSFLTSTTELERRGKRQVKVIKTSLIYDLIQQAVDRVQRESGHILDDEQREALVEESKAEFNRLLDDHQTQKQEIQGLHDKIHGLEEALKVAKQVAADREQQLTKQRAENASRDENAGQLHEMIRRREAELEDATRAQVDVEEYRLKIAGLTAELKAMRENQPAAESLLNELRAMREDVKALETRNRELETKAASAPVGGGDTSALEALFEKKMAQISSEISAKLANVSSGGGEVLGTSPEDIKLTIQKIFSDEIDGKVDSNIGEIEVKQKTSEGIASNLERLKNLGLKSKNG